MSTGAIVGLCFAGVNVGALLIGFWRGRSGKKRRRNV